MTRQQIIHRYSSLGSPAKVRFLARVSFELTVGLRDEDDSTDLVYRVKRLRGANELQHHLSSELAKHHDQDEKRYPDEVLINILWEKAEYYGILSETEYALNRATKAANSDC